MSPNVANVLAAGHLREDKIGHITQALVALGTELQGPFAALLGSKLGSQAGGVFRAVLRFLCLLAESAGQCRQQLLRLCRMHALRSAGRLQGVWESLRAGDQLYTHARGEGRPGRKKLQ